MSSILPHMVMNPGAGLADAISAGTRNRLAREQFELEKQQAEESQRRYDTQLEQAQLQKEQEATLPTLDFAKNAVQQIQSKLMSGDRKGAAAAYADVSKQLQQGLGEGVYSQKIGAELANLKFPELPKDPKDFKDYKKRVLQMGQHVQELYDRYAPQVGQAAAAKEQEQQQKLLQPTLEFMRSTASDVRRAFEQGGQEQAQKVLNTRKRILEQGIRNGQFNTSVAESIMQAAAPTSMEQAQEYETLAEQQISGLMKPEEREKRQEALATEAQTEQVQGIESAVSSIDSRQAELAKSQQMLQAAAQSGMGGTNPEALQQLKQGQQLMQQQNVEELSAAVDREAQKDPKNVTPDEADYIKKMAGFDLDYAKKLAMAAPLPDRNDKLNEDQSGALAILQEQGLASGQLSKNENLLMGHPKYQEALQEHRKRINEAIEAEHARKKGVAKAGRDVTSINISPTTKARAEEAVKDSIDMQGKIDRAREIINGEYGKYFGPVARTKGTAMKVVDKLGGLEAVENLGPEAKDAVQTYRRYLAAQQHIGDINLATVHKYFGGALTASEIKRQVGIIIDAKSMSGTEIQTALLQLEDTARRGEAVNTAMLRSPYKKGDRLWREEANNLYKQYYVKDLADKNMNPEQISKYLNEKAYISLSPDEVRGYLGIAKGGDKPIIQNKPVQPQAAPIPQEVRQQSMGRTISALKSQYQTEQDPNKKIQLLKRIKALESAQAPKMQQPTR